MALSLLNYLLVMTSRHFKLAEEYVSVAKVTMCPPLSRLIPKLFSNEKPLPNKTTFVWIKTCIF